MLPSISPIHCPRCPSGLANPTPITNNNMTDPVYKVIELTGTSTTTIEAAVEQALARAHKTLNKLRWFQVTETRGSIDKGKLKHWQVTIKVGFAIED